MDIAKDNRSDRVQMKIVGTVAPEVTADSQSIPTPTYFAFWSTSPESYPLFSHSLLCSIVLFLSATGTLPLVQSIFQPFLSSLSLFLLRVTFLLTATLSMLHQFGALRRYAIKFAEDELSKNLNKTLVTLSDLQIDLWRGKVIAQDLIIHNKDRDDWEWDAPCLARVGRIEATLNLSSVIQLPKIGHILNHTFFDVYTVLVEDVQVFAEKRINVLNFHLLDPSLDIPDASVIMEQYNKLTRRKQELGRIIGQGSGSINMDREEEREDLACDCEEGSLVREREEKANKIVEKLVGAVSRIGKAANEGGSKGFQSALMNQKDGLVQNLKELHTQTETEPIPGCKDWKSKKEYGVSVMRELGKVVETNVRDIKDQVLFLNAPPSKKPGWQPKPPDYVRVGAILLREARIFTKDILVAKGGNGDDADNVASEILSNSSSHSRKGEKVENTSNCRLGWARPIVIFELAMTGAELCPPMTARCPETGMPVVGISIDRLADMILKRIMAEVAKSNSGRLFQTAFGDVFSFVHDNVSEK